jgi:hypothetical protein
VTDRPTSCRGIVTMVLAFLSTTSSLQPSLFFLFVFRLRLPSILSPLSLEISYLPAPSIHILPGCGLYLTLNMQYSQS